MMTGVTRLIQITQRRLGTTRLKRLGQIQLFRPLITGLGRMARAADFTTTVHGVRLTMPGHVDYYTDRFEPETVKWLSSNLRPGVVVADIGVGTPISYASPRRATELIRSRRPTCPEMRRGDPSREPEGGSFRA